MIDGMSSTENTLSSDLYRQVEGGSIGLRLTGVVARVVMDIWRDLMTASIRRMKVEIYLLIKYVNDVNLAVSLVP